MIRYLDKGLYADCKITVTEITLELRDSDKNQEVTLNGDQIGELLKFLDLECRRAQPAVDNALETLQDAIRKLIG